MPVKKQKKRKPVLQKQKQKQEQRVVVNVTQAKAKRQARRRAPQPRQQVIPQTLVVTSGSVPQPMPFYNPQPIQMTGGFLPQPAPAGLGAPLEVPVFAGETPKVIGDEEVSVRASVPVSEITPISRREEPIIIQQPPPRPEQPLIISTPTIRSPQQVFSDTEEFLRKRREATASAPPQFIIDPPSVKSDSKSIASIFSDISKDSGITSEKIAKKIFGKNKEPPQILSLINPNPSENSSSIQTSISSITDGYGLGDITVRPSRVGSDLTSATNYDSGNNQEFFTSPTQNKMSVAGAPASLPTISTRPSFYNPSVKGGEFTNNPIIVPPKEIVVLKKPELKRSKSSPFDIFSDNESKSSLNIIPEMGVAKPMPSRRKDRVPVMSSESERELNIIAADAPAGRRLPPVKEKKNNYKSLEELQFLAKNKGIVLIRPNGKKKTRNELILEIM